MRSAVKAAEASRDIPLMFFRAEREVQERVEGLALVAVDFISKPIRLQELLARVGARQGLGLRAELENRAAEGTVELHTANQRLQAKLSERRLVERALRESEQRCPSLAGTVPVGIGVTGPDTLFRSARRHYLSRVARWSG